MAKISWRLAVLNSIFTPFAILVSATPLIAQPIVPAPDGTNTIVTPEGNRIDITGGQRSRDGVNLFHSFTRFGLSSEQIANFLSQPNIQNILARINGGEASFINGLIQVTGGNSNLFLINPAGIIFGSNASLNVPASFLATTANGIGFGNNWFNAIGNNNYADLVGTPNAFAFTMSQPGSILNAGNLVVGMGQDLTLLAGTVVNTGTLSAPSGNITLAAVPGESIVHLSQPGFVLNLEIQPLTTAGNQPQNWTLPILSLPQLLTGGNGDHATGVTVNPDGSVQLTGSGLRIPIEGKTTIASGSINVSGQTGGTVNVIGDKIGLVDANINASGTNGGGKVLIGGDYQGKGTIPNASRTYVSSNSAISVDSFVAGNGGSVIIWADKVTGFYGSISAKGGSNSGDGGFVEVSGKDSLIFAGKVDTRAANGNLGTLLLDPINITIVDGQQATDDGELGDNQILQEDSASNDFRISAIALENLPANANIILEATNNITVNDLADDALNLKATTGSITFKSDADRDGVGSFSMDATDSIETKGGSVTISGKNITIGGINTNGGNITLDAIGNIDTKAGVINSSNTGNNGGNITLKSGGNIIFSGIISRAKDGGDGGNITLTAGGSITTPKGTSNDIASDANKGNGGDITFKAGGDIVADDIEAFGLLSGGNIELISGGTIDTTTVDTVLNTPGNIASCSASQSGCLGANGKGGTITLQATKDIFTGAINSNGVLGGGNVKLTSSEGAIDTSAGNIDTGTANFSTGNSGTVTLNAQGDITTASINTIVGFKSTGNAGTISLTSKAGAIDTSKGVLDAGTTFGNGGKIEFNAAGNITTGRILSYVVNQGSGNAGNISLISTGGAIDTTKGITNDETKANLDSRSDGGNGGTITLNAAGDITTLNINSFSVTKGEGGAVSFTTSGGNITITGGIDARSKDSTVTGKGGDITLNAANNITTTGPGNITANSSNGNAGNITFNAGGNIIVQGPSSTDINAVSNQGGFGGNITIKAGKDIQTDDIQAFGDRGGGNITVIGGKIDTRFTDQTLKTVGGILSCSGKDGCSGGSGKGGTIILQADTDIFVGNINASGPTGGGDISVTGNEINFVDVTVGSPALVTGKGNLLLQPATPGQAIAIGKNSDSGTNTLDITTNELATLKDGFSSITIGRTDSNGQITIDDSITFSDPLTIQSPLGSILFNGAITGVDNASITLNGNTSLNSNITTADQNLTINGNTTLGNNIILSTGGTGGGDIAINGTVDGNNNLVLEAGTGNIILNGAVGNNTRLGNLTINSAGNVQTQSITAASITQIAGTGTTTLGSLNVDTAAGINLTGNIFNLDGDINASNNGGLTIDNSSSLNIAATRNINLDGGFNQIGTGEVFTAGNITTTNDDIRFNGPVTLTGNATFNPGVGAIAFNSSVSAGNNPLILKAWEIDFGGTVSGTNTLVLQPATKEQNIAIAGSIPGALNLTAAEIANLQNGFSSITIGRSDGTGNVTVNNVTFNDPITIQSGLGAIAINAPITGKDASITLKAVTTTLKAGITTTDQNILIEGGTLLANDVIISTGNGPGDITFAGTVDGTKQLQLNAGEGNVRFNAAAGFVTPLASLEIIKAQNIFVAGGIATANSDITFNSPGILTDDATFKAGAANITLNSSISAESGEANDLGATAEGNVFTSDIATGGGNISLSSNKGSVTTGTLDASSSQGKGGAIALTAPAGAIAAGNLTARGATGGGNVTVISGDRINTGNIDVSTNKGDGGNVFIDPPGDVEVGFINAQGGTGGKGGNVDITTERFFRSTSTFTDRNGVNSSISTAGETDSGSVIIRHGGGDLSTFFIVDDPNTNGTLGALTTGADTISPTRFFPGSYRLGNIQIITSDRFASTLAQSDILRENPPPQEIIGDIPRAPIDAVVSALEEIFTRQYETYFGQRNLTPIKSLEEIRATLLAAEQATGVKSAVLYIAFGRGKVGIEALLANPLQTSPRQGSDQKIIINQEAVRDRTDQDILELVLVTAAGETIRHRVEGVTRSQIIAVAEQLQTEVTDRTKVFKTNYLTPSQQLYQWLIAPLETELQARGIKNLVFIPDVGLRTLPIAVLHNGQGFIVEQYSVSLMPSFSLTNPRYVNLKNASVLAMGASTFTNQTNLPAVPVELNTITPVLWPGKTALDEAFTVDNLQSFRTCKDVRCEVSTYEIVHLATHAVFQPGPPSNSYIQFWNTKLQIDQIKHMKWNNPPVDLLALSACKTAIGDEQVELGFAGIAVQTGVNSALASLWEASDQGTLGLMTEFYEQLKTSAIRVEALRQAQVAMIRQQVYIQAGKLYGPAKWGIPLPPQLALVGNQDLSHPHYWAAFTMIGNPW